jgi:hypothetical protein
LLVKVIEEEVVKRGVHTRLCPPDLHTMFTACINKASLEAGAQQEAKTRETKEDFLRLGLVGGARIIRLLLEEAAKHKGQAASVAGILSLLHPICSHKVGEGSRTLLPVFIGGMLSKEEEGNNEDGSVNQPKKNLVGLCLALLKLRPSYTEDLLLTSLPPTHQWPRPPRCLFHGPSLEALLQCLPAPAQLLSDSRHSLCSPPQLPLPRLCGRTS